MIRWVCAVLLAAGVVPWLAGCAGADKPKPTPLETFEPRIAGRQVWQARIGEIGFPLAIHARGGAVVAASSDGTVASFDLDTGRERWRTSAGAPLAAGVGSDGRFVAVVTRDNELVVLDQARPLWRHRLPSRVVTAPFVAGERVFVLAVDRVVHAFDALDGRKLWAQQRPGEALTLAQPGVLTSFGDLLLVGQGPRLAALDALRGEVRWDVAMATPRGTNEVERLADLVGPGARVGNRFCARAYQAAVACVDAARGSLLWSRNVGGFEAVGADAERVFGADPSGRITAWRTDSGEALWTQERLLHRGLSGAAVVGPTVVFGDLEGQVHFLSTRDGQPQLRLPTDGSAVVGAPLLVSNTLLVATRRGGLFAFRPN